MQYTWPIFAAIALSLASFWTGSAALYSSATDITCQLSVENDMAKSAAAANENIEAKHKVTALQNAIVNTTNFTLLM